MFSKADVENIERSIELLRATQKDRQLSVLRSRCLDDGIWAIDPSKTRSPVFYSITLHGIDAMTMDLTDLPRTWIKVAENTLKSLRSNAGNIDV